MHAPDWTFGSWNKIFYQLLFEIPTSWHPMHPPPMPPPSRCSRTKKPENKQALNRPLLDNYQDSNKEMAANTLLRLDLHTSRQKDQFADHWAIDVFTIVCKTSSYIIHAFTCMWHIFSKVWICSFPKQRRLFHSFQSPLNMTLMQPFDFQEWTKLKEIIMSLRSNRWRCENWILALDPNFQFLW